jgi:hypothetical protein
MIDIKKACCMQFRKRVRNYEGDQVKEDEMGGAYRKIGRDEKCVQNFDRKTCREEITRKT